VETSPAGSIGSASQFSRGVRGVTIFSLILGGALGFSVLMSAVAGHASAATGDSLTSDVSLATSVGSTDLTSADSPVVSADATVSGDGTQVTADSPVVSADATVSTDGAQLSTDSPVGSADATVSTDGADLSADSPVGSADATLSTDATNPSALDLSLTSSAPVVGPAEEPIDAPSNDIAETLAGSAPSAGLSDISPRNPDIQAAASGNVSPSGPYPHDPANPYSPAGSSGLSPTPTSSGGHGADALLAWASLIAILGLLWYLVTSRSPVPHGNGDILALPG
jgi:hypothetical protein